MGEARPRQVGWPCQDVVIFRPRAPARVAVSLASRPELSLGGLRLPPGTQQLVSLRGGHSVEWILLRTMQVAALDQWYRDSVRVFLQSVASLGSRWREAWFTVGCGVCVRAEGGCESPSSRRAGEEPAGAA